MIRSIGLILVFVLFAGQGFGQLNSTFFKANQKKYTIISSLDLLAKLPDSKLLPITKQRSIFDSDKLPFFCKFEHKLSQKSKLNLRMRLGSLDYVNKLEGKN